MIKVSIIIPVYNSQDYLAQCLQSCVDQTLEEVEVIVINDASPDNSDVIMKEFEIKYPQKIRCVYLRDNIRQGGARNIGIGIARGEYLTFVDSDDWINSRMCENLYNRAIKENADIVYCNNYSHTSKGVFEEERFPAYMCGRGTDDKVKAWRILGLRTGPVAAIIKKDIFNDEICKFPEKFFSEDSVATKLWSLRADIIDKDECSYYHYRMNYVSPTKKETRECYNSDMLNCSVMLFSRLGKWDDKHRFEEEIQIICAWNLLSMASCYLDGFVTDYSTFISFVNDFDKSRRIIAKENLIHNRYFTRWFTPNQQELILNGALYFKKFDGNDYYEYYKNHRNIIHSKLRQMRASKTNSAIWSNTMISNSFNKVFPDYDIIDENSYKGCNYDNIISLRIGHNRSISKLMPECRIIDIQFLLLMDVD